MKLVNTWLNIGETIANTYLHILFGVSVNNNRILFMLKSMLQFTSNPYSFLPVKLMRTLLFLK